MSVLLPTIHINGTSKESLLKQYEDCYSAVSTALDKLREARPNGRDYYPQNTSDDMFQAYGYARDQHEAWISQLKNVKNDLEDLIIGIHDGGHKVEKSLV